MFKSYVRQILDIVFEPEFHDQRQLARIRMMNEAYLDELREIYGDLNWDPKPNEAIRIFDDTKAVLDFLVEGVRKHDFEGIALEMVDLAWLIEDDANYPYFFAHNVFPKLQQTIEETEFDELQLQGSVGGELRGYADRGRSLKMDGVRVDLQKENEGWKIREIK